MEGLLTEIKSTKQQGVDDQSPAFVIREATKPSENSLQSIPRTPSRIDSARKEVQVLENDDILQLLRSEPDQETLSSALQHLDPENNSPIDLRLPGPLQAQIIHTLVDTILPTFWQVLDTTYRRTLVRYLTSIAGINAVLAKLQHLVAVQRTASRTPANIEQLTELLEVLDALLKPTDLLTKLWQGLASIRSQNAKHNLAWKEIVNVLGSGKVQSIQAEAYDTIKHTALSSYVATNSGLAYASWLTHRIVNFAINAEESSQTELASAAAQLLSRALNLGYAHTIVSGIIRQCLEHDCRDEGIEMLTSMLAPMPMLSKRRFLDAVLTWLSSSFHDETNIQAISYSGGPRIACLLQRLSAKDNSIQQQLANVITDTAVSAKLSFAVRQATILVLLHEGICDLATSLEKSMAIFGDQLFIDHAPMLQQDALSQNVLLLASYLWRKRPSSVTIALRSGRHMQAISNRLACSSPRARWLGMIVGTALSRLTDKPNTQMNFGTSDMDTAEARLWLDILNVKDEIAPMNDFLPALDQTAKVKKTLRTTRTQKTAETLPLINGKQSFGPPRPPAMLQTEIVGERVEELLDDISDADDDLKPYAKPDSDPEDSDEDATLVNRNKAKPPVYIRTLMSMLRETENAEKFQLAIKHAAPLIRRKKGFGREVSDHAEELARILSSLQDPFETEDFDELRLHALIALVLSDVDAIAPWLSRQAFAQNYSIAQRSIILTALGLSGRELAGFKNEDQLNRTFENTAFPSKQLPSRLHATYAQPGQSRIEIASKNVEQSMIQPMALAAADQTTSHLDAVKVRKFSSRMEVERTRRKPTANRLAKVFGIAFFRPLLGSFQQEVAAYGDSSAYFSSPVLLTTFLKTLALLLHASGPATADLIQVTAEFWETLLHLRVRATSDITIMEALLFSFLTLLEVNQDKQNLATNSPKQLVETKEWAEMVFERAGGGNLIEGEGEEARVRTLCAGVLTRANEIIADYQRVLMGF